MTSQVKITAHCASNKQVRVTVRDGDRMKEVKFLENGQEVEMSVYDNLEVSVKEREVEAQMTALISDGDGQVPKPPVKP